jgi:hypothetical protein
VVVAVSNPIAMEQILEQSLPGLFGAKPARGRTTPATRSITSRAPGRGYSRAARVAPVKNRNNSRRCFGKCNEVVDPVHFLPPHTRSLSRFFSPLLL